MTDPQTEQPETTFKRVMLKISGEALMGDQGFGLHPPSGAGDPKWTVPRQVARRTLLLYGVFDYFGSPWDIRHRFSAQVNGCFRHFASQKRHGDFLKATFGAVC